jgi:hypothetical protein
MQIGEFKKRVIAEYDIPYCTLTVTATDGIELDDNDSISLLRHQEFQPHSFAASFSDQTKCERCGGSLGQRWHLHPFKPHEGDKARLCRVCGRLERNARHKG